MISSLVRKGGAALLCAGLVASAMACSGTTGGGSGAELV